MSITSDSEITAITGATDQTEIGNVGDRLKVTGDNPGASGNPGAPVFSDKYRVVFSPTDVNLTTTIANVFTYNGSGKFSHFIIQSDKSSVLISLKIDGEIIFSDLPLVDVALLDVKNTLHPGSDATGDSKKFIFSPKYPIQYDTSVIIDAKTSTGTAIILNNIVELTKET